VLAGTITSLPFSNSKALRAKIKASSPDATPAQYLTPQNLANSSSKFSTFLPKIYQPL
jgi:hypothetical protein